MNIRSARILLLVIAILFLLSGCGPSEAKVPQPEPTLPALENAPGAAPTAVPSDYPAPEIVAPATPTMDPDYPAPPTLLPTVDAYPGGLVWVIHPVGIQCEEGTLPGYGDLREAASTMTAAGVSVVEAEMTELIVAASCGSPTSAHFRLQIDAEDLQTALSMDWIQE